MDQTADPCDDFYQFACGGWMENNVIPDDSSRWGIFYELRDKVNIANRRKQSFPTQKPEKPNMPVLLSEILETPVDGSEPEAVQKVKNLYAACADTGDESLPLYVVYMLSFEKKCSLTTVNKDITVAEKTLPLISWSYSSVK